MDLGRPVARHLIHRPHEAVELEQPTAEEAVDERTSEQTPVRSEHSER
jgi:microcompartment protein CcmL/EutN